MTNCQALSQVCVAVVTARIAQEPTNVLPTPDSWKIVNGVPLRLHPVRPLSKPGLARRLAPPEGPRKQSSM